MKKTPFQKMRSIMAKLDNELAKEAKEKKKAMPKKRQKDEE